MEIHQEQVAVITGAASGIGQELALQLSWRGLKVIMGDVNEKGLAETHQKIEQYGGWAQSHHIDVSKADELNNWAEKIYQEQKKIDILINNAGVALGRIPVGKLSPEQWEWIFGINFWGVVRGTEAFLPYLKQNIRGHIVNISSIFGIIGVGEQAPYVSTKFAVRGFTESLIQEMKLHSPHIGITAVHPGGIKTNIALNAKGIPDSERVKSAQNFEKNALTSSAEAARQIIQGIIKNRRKVIIGKDARFLDYLNRLLPTKYHRTVLNFLDRVEV